MATRVYKLIGMWLITAALSCCGSTETGDGQHIYILDDVKNNQLCGYTKESEWGPLAAEGDSGFTAVVISKKGVPVIVTVIAASEDTTNYDEYTLTADGSAIRLKRDLDDVTDRVSREQIWIIRAGRATKVSEAWSEYQTHKPVEQNRHVSGLNEYPVVVRRSDFPFSALLSDGHPERWPNGKRWVVGNMRALAASAPKLK